MEMLAIASYAQSPESYKNIPKMAMTDLNEAMEVVNKQLSDLMAFATLPNVFVLGDVSAGASEVAQFLYSNHVCGPSNKDLHFFDLDNQYDQGATFYAKNFEHCSSDDIIMDVLTSETLMHADRVKGMYGEVKSSNLKILVTLDESVPGVYGRYLDVWADLFDRKQMLILSFSELQQYPQRAQWRIEQFLDKSFEGQLEVDEDVSKSAPSYSSARNDHQKFDYFMNALKGPWMEQRPFPQGTATKKFAYASVLGWNPDATQNKLYLDALRVMIQSLKDSSADYIVLMMNDDKEAEAQLQAEGAIVKVISPMQHSLDAPYFEPWFVDIALAKLRAFELTAYKRIQVLDVDASVESAERMDELFTSYPNVHLVAEGLGSDSPLRAGWLMIEPSLTVFDDLQKILERGVFSSELGWDDMNLPVEYPGWEPANPKNNWEFYGSQLEQGK
jgi:hypothetical protein